MITGLLKKYRNNIDGVAAAEFALVFPIMFFLILGIWDIGNGLWVGQKVIKSSHMVADLLGRESEVSNDELAQAFEAGRIAMQPFDDAPLTIEVYSLSFRGGNPSIEWEEAYNTSTDNNFINYVEDLGTDGSLVVRVRYRYEPIFGSILIPPINMNETVYVKGRQVDVIQRIE